MIKELDILREMGAQKIYEETHITLKHVQSIIHESFEDLTQVQFLGFVSILEREYNQDLSALRELGIEYFQEEEQEERHQNPSLFQKDTTKSNFSRFYIFLILIVIAVAIFFSFKFTSEKMDTRTLDNTNIENAKKNIPPVIQVVETQEKSTTDTNLTKTLVIENNTTKESNTPTILLEKKDLNLTKAPIALKVPVQAKLEKVKTKKIKKTLSPLVIKPRTRVWIGYINTTDKEKHQAVVKHILTLNPNKVWLISMGHGNVNITLNAKTTKYSSAKSIRFLYKNAKLKKLTITEFKKLNNGRLW